MFNACFGILKHSFGLDPDPSQEVTLRSAVLQFLAAGLGGWVIRKPRIRRATCPKGRALRDGEAGRSERSETRLGHLPRVQMHVTNSARVENTPREFARKRDLPNRLLKKAAPTASL